MTLENGLGDEVVSAVAPTGAACRSTSASRAASTGPTRVMAAAAAEALGVPADRRSGGHGDGGARWPGRFTVRTVGGVRDPAHAGQEPGRLGRAARPGAPRRRARWWWASTPGSPTGSDPSWLWDVPFERLAGRPVVATGERCRDLAVRLRYAEVAHETVPDPREAVGRGGRTGGWAADACRVDVHRQLHGLPRPAGAAAVSGRAPSPWPSSTPTSSGPTATVATGWCWPAGREWRGIAAELLEADSDEPLPEADLYCLGGGEDGPQVRAAEALVADGTLARAVEAGAVVLAVCAGYQIVGRSFPDADGAARPGARASSTSTTVKGTGPRAVGEVLAEPVAPGPGGRDCPR